VQTSGHSCTACTRNCAARVKEKMNIVLPLLISVLCPSSSLSPLLRPLSPQPNFHSSSLHMNPILVQQAMNTKSLFCNTHNSHTLPQISQPCSSLPLDGNSSSYEGGNATIFLKQNAFTDTSPNPQTTTPIRLSRQTKYLLLL